jgi:putative flippase GtrA
MALKIDLAKQILRFIVIGTLAALVNFSIVIALVEANIMSPLLANVFAFAVAFQVSYFGHRYWTFSRTINAHKIALPRLFVISGSSFIANEGIFYLFLNLFQLPYIFALFLTLTILPIISFVFNKLWVFQEA